jgi:transposase InsO family protein
MELLESYQDVFCEDAVMRSSASKVKHRIITENVAPVAKRPYRVPHHQKGILREEIDRLLKAEVIRPSSSPWSAPVVLIVKELPNGERKVRMCIDYRGLNAVTKQDFYPLPNLQETLDSFCGANLFTVLDVTSAFHQIDMEEQDKEKTAFTTPDGHYEFNKLPFGLMNSPSTFQRFMNTTLSGLTGEICLVYLDDILVFNSGGVSDHLSKLSRVLDRIRDANIKLKPSKCEFLVSTVKYVGHIISQDGIRPDPSKFEAIRNYPVPKSVRDVRAFLGLAGWYRRFIKDFSIIAAPLTNLTKKEESFSMNKEAMEAFNQLKSALTSESVVAHPDFTKPFILTTDASKIGISAILSQLHDGFEKPIAYASKKLTRPQKNYSATELECLAVVEGIKYFRCYLYGRRFTVVTDHRPLKWLMNLKDSNSRLARWSLMLSTYDFEIVHRPGRKHGNADALSRIEIEEAATNPEVEINTVGVEKFVPVWDRHRILQEQKIDPFCKQIAQQMTDDPGNLPYFHDNEGLLYKITSDGREVLVVPKTFVSKVLRDFHSLPFGGHKGQEKTLNLIKSRFFWNNMKADVVNFCKQCHSCNERKTPPHLKKVPLLKFPEVTEPFERTAMDIVGPFVTSYSGNRYLLTFQDHFTRYVEAIPLPDQKAETVAKAFVSNIICRHSTPKQLLTDQGTNFLSSLFKEICSCLQIEKLQTTAYHPEANGVIERSHRVFKDTMSHYVSTTQQDWDEWIPHVLMAYRFSIHRSTGFSPHFLLYGRDPVLPFDDVLRANKTPRYDADHNYVSEMLGRMANAYKKVRENLAKSIEAQAVYYNRKARDRDFHLGDLVYVSNPAFKRGLTRKLCKHWEGPYRIIDIKGPATYKIRKVNARKEQVVHANRLKLVAEPDLHFDDPEKEPGGAESENSTDTEGEDADDDETPGAVNPRDVTLLLSQALQANVGAPVAGGQASDPPLGLVEEDGVKRSARPRRPPKRFTFFIYGKRK